MNPSSGPKRSARDLKSTREEVHSPTPHAVSNAEASTGAGLAVTYLIAAVDRAMSSPVQRDTLESVLTRNLIRTLESAVDDRLDSVVPALLGELGAILGYLQSQQSLLAVEILLLELIGGEERLS